MSDWQPISTAPLRTKVLVIWYWRGETGDGGADSHDVAYLDRPGDWRLADTSLCSTPTHWMPLPEAPKP